MLRIKHIVQLTLLVFSYSNLSAEISYLNCDDKNKLTVKPVAELSKIQSTYAALNKFKVKFNQNSFLAALDFSEASSGDIYFKQEANMRWIYKTPEEQEFLIKDNKFYFYQKQDEQVLVQDLDDVLSSDAPIAFLFGIGNLTSDFNFERACKSSDGQFIFVLTPKVKAEVASYRELIIKNSKSYYPEIIQVHHIGGNITAVKLVGYKENVELSDRDFVLDVPKGVDIIDKRKSS